MNIKRNTLFTVMASACLLVLALVGCGKSDLDWPDVEREGGEIIATIAEGAGAIYEGGASSVEPDAIEVVLSLSIRPTSDVLLTPTFSDATLAARLELAPAAIVFPRGQLGVQQTMTIIAKEDEAENFNSGPYTIEFVATSADDACDGLTCEFELTVYDNDNRGIAITPASAQTITEGSIITYSVRLMSPPSSDITVNITTDSVLLGRVQMPASLDFTTINWQTPQPMPVSAVDDTLYQGAAAMGTLTLDSDGYEATKTVALTVLDNEHWILASASPPEGGTIMPAGGRAIRHGASRVFTITPNDGWRIADVLVDGVPKGPLSSYTLSNVDRDHTITASFVPITYTITVIQSDNGNINPGTSLVQWGRSLSFTIEANQPGFGIATISVTSASGSTETVPEDPFVPYHLNVGPVYEDKTITATYLPKLSITYTISGDGSVQADGMDDSPSPLYVLSGATPNFTFMPHSNEWGVLSVAVEGTPVTTSGADPFGVRTYRFPPVTADLEMAVTFEQVFVITPLKKIQGNPNIYGGTISPPTPQRVFRNASIDFTLDPNNLSQINSVWIDNVLDADPRWPTHETETFTFDEVIQNHEIMVQFGVYDPSTHW